MLQVMPRDGAHAEVGEEFSLVEHPPEQTFHAMAAQQRKQMTLLHAGLVPTRDEIGQVGTVVEEPVQALGEFRHLVEQRRFKHLNGKERD